VTEDRGGGSVQEIFLGLAVTAGGTEASVIPFFSPGLPVEYELARAIRAAGNESKKKIGVLDTEAGLFAKFDFQTMQPGRDWPIVTELKKQYKVERVTPPTADAKIPADIDVLIVAQPSTMTPDEFAGVLDYIKSGRAAIILEDPMPIVNPAIGSNEQRRPANPMMGGDPRSQQPKADLKPLFELLGARVATDSVAWDTYNPHPNLAGVPPEFIWLNRTAPWAKTVSPFNETEAITSGLQEVVMLFPGRIERTETKKPAEGSGTVASGPDFTALMRSSPTSGQMPVSSIVQRTMFGTTFNENRKPIRTNTSQVLAALIKGKSGESNVNVILLGDLDMVSETFFNLREQGSGATGGLEFDNVTFILNCVDVLSGDQSLLDLRKKRRTYRTLETLEARRQSEINSAKAAQSTAETEAETKLAEAQARLNAEVKKVQDRQDLDESAKRVMVETVRTAEQRRVDAQTKTIEDQKKQAIEDARLQTRAEIERIQTGIRLAAVTLPPVPALAIGLAVMIRRRGREAESARKERAG